MKQIAQRERIEAVLNAENRETQKQQNKMFKPTPKKRVLFVRRLCPVVFAVFGVISILAANIHSPNTAYAASTNTVNFQARLQTASGAIVPDGNYNIEFKLYSGGSCVPSTGSGCTEEWSEDYLNSASKGLQTVNGYLSANLGSVTAFPSTVKWDQKLWLSMNVGGTATIGTFPSIGDGAMLPYLSLTSVPAAFSASQLATTNSNGRSTLTLQGSSSGDQDFVIQDQGAAGTYNLLTQNQADATYMQNTADPQAATFNITGAGTADTLQGNTAIISPSIRAKTDSTSGIQFENSTGDITVMTIDTENSRVGIGTTVPSATLDVQSGGLDYSTSALNVENSIGSALLNIRDDGQFTVGASAASSTSATIGSSDATGSTPDSGSDNNIFTATKVSTGTHGGALTKLSIYINSINADPAHDKYRLAIYADGGANKPTTLIAQSAEGTLVANSLNSLPVNASLAANTTYWLAYVTNGTSSGDGSFSYKSAAAGTYYAFSYAYAPFSISASTGGSNGAIAMVISGTYAETGTGTIPALTVSANGNVGIGVGSPIYALQVQGTASASAYLQNGNTVCDISNNCGGLTSSTGIQLQTGTPAAQTGSLDITGAAIAGSLQAASLDTASAGALTLGMTNATSIVLGNVASGNYITFTAAGGLVATGSGAQHTKYIALTAEYAGAVLDATSDTSCSASNNGSMTSAYDGINNTNYYKWASNATAQCYDVVVRVPIPLDWTAWANTTPITVSTYSANTSTGLVNLQVLKASDGTAESGCDYANITPSSNSTWSTSNSSNCAFASVNGSAYTAGSTMTLRIRMTGNAGSDVRIDGITIAYKSKF